VDLVIVGAQIYRRAERRQRILEVAQVLAAMRNHHDLARLRQQSRRQQGQGQEQPSHLETRYCPMSSFHSAGSLWMKFWSKRKHSGSSTTSIWTPRSTKYSSGPRNVRFSPITTLGMRYRRMAPLHISHGESVVYMVARW